MPAGAPRPPGRPWPAPGRLLKLTLACSDRYSRDVRLSPATSPHRLARPRTSPFHGGNRGSNPLGDAKLDSSTSIVWNCLKNDGGSGFQIPPSRQPALRGTIPRRAIGEPQAAARDTPSETLRNCLRCRRMQPHRSPLVRLGRHPNRAIQHGAPNAALYGLWSGASVLVPFSIDYLEVKDSELDPCSRVHRALGRCQFLHAGINGTGYSLRQARRNKTLIVHSINIDWSTAGVVEDHKAVDVLHVIA